MKKIMSFVAGLAMMATSVLPTFADTAAQDIARSAAIQKSEAGIYYGVPSYLDSNLFNFTDKKDVSWDAYTEILNKSNDKTALTLGNYSYSTEYKSVYKTDLKTKKKTSIINGVDVYDIYVSGNSLFVELENYDVYRYDVTGKQTALFKAVKDQYFQVVNGLYLAYKATANDAAFAVSYAGEKDTKLKALGTYSDFYASDMEGRTFFFDTSTLYEIVSGKAVKIGTADKFVATKTDIVYSSGSKVYRVAKGSAAKLIFTAGRPVKQMKIAGTQLLVLDEAKILRTMGLDGKNVKQAMTDVSAIAITAGKIYVSYFSDNGAIREFVLGEQPKVTKVANADANLFVINGKRMAYVDHLGILRYRDDFKAADKWKVDLRLYSPSTYEDSMLDARQNQIFLTKDRVYFLGENEDAYSVKAFDLDGKQQLNISDITLLRIKDGKTLYIEDEKACYSINMLTGETKTYFERTANGEFSLNLNGYQIDYTVSKTVKNYFDVKIAKNGTVAYSAEGVDMEFWIDENNIAFASETKGWDLFNALTGKVTNLFKQHDESSFEVSTVKEMTSDYMILLSDDSDDIFKVNLKTGDMSSIYKTKGDEYFGVFKGENGVLTIGHDDGSVEFLDFATGELVMTDLNYDDFEDLTLIRKGDTIYYYDNALLAGVYNLKTGEIYHFYDLE